MHPRVHGIWALAILPLLLAPPAHAEGAVEVVSSHLTLLGGGNATALLESAVFRGEGCAGLSVLGHARHVHLVVDQQSTPVTLNNVALSPTEELEPVVRDFTNATLTIRNVQPGCRVLSWTDAGQQAWLTFPRGDFSLEAAAPVPNTHQGHGAPRRTVSVGGGELLNAMGGSGLAKAWGGLHLGIWDATLEIRSDEGSYEATLGQSDTALARSLWDEPLPLSRTVEAEAFLDLEGASLSLSFPAQAQVLAHSTHIDAPAGEALLHDAVLPSDASVLPQILLSGPRGEVRPAGLQMVASFEAETFSTIGGSAPSGIAKALSLWALGAGGVLLATGLGTRRWAIAGMRRAADADACERAALLALAVWPASAESRTTRVVCLLRLGRLEAAARALKPRRWRSQQATRSFLQARLEATRGDAAGARRHLVDCLLLAPAFVADARADVALHGIVEGALGRVDQLQTASREGYA